MDEKTMEKMEKEYRSALALPDDALERIVDLEEEQLDALEELLFRLNDRNRTASYIKTIVYRILSLLAGIRNGTYLPSMRTRCPSGAPLPRLKRLQVDIFVLYDRLAPDYAALAELLSLENRKAALISGLS